MASPRQREDYLVELQSRVVDALQDLFKATNTNIATAYGLALLFLLVSWGKVTKFVLFGAEIPLNHADMALLLPGLTAVMYVLILYQLQRTAACFRELQRSAEEIRKLNTTAHPFDISDLNWIAAGVPGLMLTMSRLISRAIASTSPLTELLDRLRDRGVILALLGIPRFIGRSLLWMSIGFVLTSATAALIFLPMVMVIVLQLGALPTPLTGVAFGLIAMEVLLALGIFIAVLRLMGVYFVEVIQGVLADLAAIPDLVDVSSLQTAFLRLTAEALPLIGIPLGSEFTSLVQALTDRTIVRRYNRDQPLVEHIAMLNNLSFLHRTLRNAYQSAATGEDDERQSKLLDIELEEVQDEYARKMVCARRLLEVMDWNKLQELQVVPPETDRSAVVDARDALNASLDYVMATHANPEEDVAQIVNNTIAALAETNPDSADEEEKLMRELAQANTVRGKLFIQLRWLWPHLGATVWGFQFEKLLPLNFKADRSPPRQEDTS